MVPADCYDPKVVFGRKSLRVVYSRHALRRMEQRGITKAEVEAVLDAPTFTFPSRADPRRRELRSTVGDRKIAVVIAPGDGAGDVVVTVWAPDEDDEDADT